MTREEAELTATNTSGRWFARRVHNGWEVVKIALPPGTQIEPVRPTIAETRRPTPAAAAHHRHFDGPGGAGGV